MSPSTRWIASALSCLWLFTLLGGAHASPSVRRAPAGARSLVLLLDGALEVHGKNALALKAALAGRDLVAQVRAALQQAGYSLAADACAHHDLEVQVVLHSAAPNDFVSVLWLRQVGVLLGVASFAPVSTAPAGGLAQAPVELVNALGALAARGSLPAKIPAGAAKDRSLVCRRETAKGARPALVSTRPMAAALAACNAQDAQGCWEAGLLIRTQALGPGGNAADACDRALQLLQQSCTLGFGPGCWELGLGQKSCFKPNEYPKEKLITFLRAFELGVPQACREAVPEAGSGLEGLRAACEALASRVPAGGTDVSPELRTFACDLGHASACVVQARAMRGGEGAARSLEGARVLFGKACDAGDASACAEAAPRAPVLPKKPPRSPSRPTCDRASVNNGRFLLGADRAAQGSRGDSGWGASAGIHGIGAKVERCVGYGGEFDASLGYIGNSGMSYDTRFGFGGALGGRSVVFFPTVGLGFGGLGFFSDDAARVQADFGFAVYGGARVFIVADRSSPGMELFGNIAWVHSRDREVRAGVFFRFGGFGGLGVTWYDYGRAVSRLVFSLEVGLGK